MSDLIERLRNKSGAWINGLWDDEAADTIERLTAERDAFKATLHDEMSENLRLRELGGALPDENITAFTERVIAERDRLTAEVAALQPNAERWRYWRKFWPALCRMEVARFARLDLRATYVQSPEQMDSVTDAAIDAARKEQP